MAGAVTAGIDIGSRSIELVVLEGGGVVRAQTVPTTFDPLGQCRRLMDGLDADRVVATGYGRRLFAEQGGLEGVGAITEIQAYAVGARALVPEAASVLDIGGQDSKIIVLDGQGRTIRFEMNDRCAAGTGKFLEFMATALQVPLPEFGAFALAADKRIPISSMCTVFAETEATSLMAGGESAPNIALGLHLAIAGRIAGQLKRVGVLPPLVFAGGVARNPCMVRLLSESLGFEPVVPRDPDTVGALGAALVGLRQLERDG